MTMEQALKKRILELRAMQDGHMQRGRVQEALRLERQEREAQHLLYEMRQIKHEFR